MKRSSLLSIATLALSLLTGAGLQAQDHPALPHCRKTEPEGFFFFRDNAVPLGATFSEFRSMMLKDPLESVAVTRSWKDRMIGMDHVRYQQTYDGAPVEGAEFTEHGRGGHLVFSNGKLAHQFPHDCSGAMPEKAALAWLFQGVSGYFAWNNRDWEDELKADLNDPAATYYPKGRLMWALDNFNDLGFNLSGQRYRLAWRFEVQTLRPEQLTAYFVDALTGEVFRKDHLSYEDGSANILTQGTQTIDTRWEGGLTRAHVLHANDMGRDIWTKSYPNKFISWGLTSEVKDGDDIWGDGGQRATTAHWMVTQAWDFFKTVYGLDGMDGKGGGVRVWADDPKLENASYIPKRAKDYLHFGSYGNAYLAVIDIAGHEFTHGVTHYSADLAYKSEPGALNESFSDIFGFEVEAFAEGGVTDWLMGEDAISDRSLEDPSFFGQPDTYQGRWWANTEGCIPDYFNDSCFVHTNSGVQNYWFYLLSQGGTHNGVTVSGIGHVKAAQIAYFSLTNTLQSASQYADSRVSAIAAATLLFGACSNEEIQTTNAWAAVNIGNASSCTTTAEDPSPPFTATIRLFPNPTNDKVFVSSFGPAPDEFQLIDLSGKALKSVRGSSHQNTEIDLSDLPNGMYFIRAVRNQKYQTFKVVKQ